MTQTTNPKLGHRWNKPKASTYSQWAILFMDRREYVRWWPVSWGPSPWTHMRFRLVTLYDQLVADEREGYDLFLAASQHRTPKEWADAERVIALLQDNVSRDELLKEHGLFLDELEYRVAVECARRRMEIG